MNIDSFIIMAWIMGMFNRFIKEYRKRGVPGKSKKLYLALVEITAFIFIFLSGALFLFKGDFDFHYNRWTIGLTLLVYLAITMECFNFEVRGVKLIDYNDDMLRNWRYNWGFVFVVLLVVVSVYFISATFAYPEIVVNAIGKTELSEAGIDTLIVVCTGIMLFISFTVFDIKELTSFFFGFILISFFYTRAMYAPVMFISDRVNIAVTLGTHLLGSGWYLIFRLFIFTIYEEKENDKLGAA